MSASVTAENTSSIKPGFYAVRAGRAGYVTGLNLQEALLQQRGGDSVDFLILLEHQPLITSGRGSSPQHWLASAGSLAPQGSKLRQVSRGRKVTLAEVEPIIIQQFAEVFSAAPLGDHEYPTTP
jgi:lipoate-protein ligase B